MARSKQILVADLVKQLGSIEELASIAIDAADNGIVGTADEIADVQRTLVLAARDFMLAAARMYSLVRLARSREGIPE
jgi:3-polyprenyl-4-hydroxybenzoate decarboxylase